MNPILNEPHTCKIRAAQIEGHFPDATFWNARLQMYIPYLNWDYISQLNKQAIHCANIIGNEMHT